MTEGPTTDNGQLPGVNLTHSDAVAALKPGLIEGIDKLGLALDSRQVELILGYVGLLHKWGSVYNLTAIKDPQEILVQHVLDCLSVVPPMLVRVGATARVLDVGSGAGLPAIMIAIVCPMMQVVALDAVAKKVAFIQQAALQLGLKNVSAQHARIENIVTADFDLIISRAFSSLRDFVEGTRGAIKAGGVWLAMKGRVPLDEIGALPQWVLAEKPVLLNVPGLSAERCLIWISSK